MARKKRKRIASRGSVNTTILKTLISGDKYGYEIIKEVEEYSEGKIVLKQPSLYSSLSRFEEKGIVSSYWGDSDIGGRRHYYHLTELGHKYYNENVLKHHNDEDEEMESTTLANSVEPSEKITITELSNDKIPEVLNFDVKEEKEIIPDHNFYNKTPIESVDREITPTKPQLSKEDDEDYKIIQRLAVQVKVSNKRAVNTRFKKLHFVRPKKAQKVVLDSDGIYKLRDIDYISTKNKKKDNIVDNVIKRTNPTIYGYPTYTESKPAPVKEITDEERKIKNQLFIEKFNHLTQSKLKPVEEKPVIQSTVVKEPDIDYRSKLDIVMENSIINTPPTPPQQNENTNNLFNYDSDDNTQFQKTNTIDEDADDKFIDFEPTEFEVKNQDTHYVEEISNYSTLENEVTFNRYEHKSKQLSDEKNYVLINKVRMVFGLIMALFLTLELAISYFIFNKYGLLVDGDNKFFIATAVLSVILVLAFILPYFVNKTKHTYNSFKLKYALILGFLTFIVMLILIYCINSLIGFELDNFKYFAVKLVVPAILAFNFVILPPIYSSLINNKRFYD